MKRYRFLFGFPLMIAFIIIGYVFISFEYQTNCIHTAKCKDNDGVQLDTIEFNSTQIKGSKNCN